MINKKGKFDIEEVYVSAINKMNSIEKFLNKNDLNLGEEIIKYLTFSKDGEIVATGAIAIGGIIKCIAIDPDYRGEGIVLKLFTELTHLCFDLGYKDLFVYTKPENEFIFRDCGCFKIESSLDVILMENSKDLLSNYCNDLKTISKEIKGSKIGSIVLNADPFTLGHQFLIESAASLCDWLHVFVVKEDSAFFSYEDRFELVKRGISHLHNVTLYEGSRYIISRATFPSYFLKNKQILDNNYAELDLKIFRHYIAPSLNITNRFLGTEPKSPITNKYNTEMKYWFEEEKMDYPFIKVSIIERKEINNEAISASKVRELFKNNQFDELKKYVPETTYNFLLANKKK